MFGNDQPETAGDVPAGGRKTSRATGWIVLVGFLAGTLSGAVLFVACPTAPDTCDKPAGKTANVPQWSESDRDSMTTDELPGASGNLAAEREKLIRKLETEQLRKEVESLRRQIDELKSTPVSVVREDTSATGSFPVGAPAAAAHPAAQAASGSSPTGAATLAYWNRMNDIILREAALRAAPLGGITAANASGFLDARIGASKYAVDALRQLDPRGVDERVVDLGGQLANWYSDGRKVAESGKALLTRGSVQRQGSAGRQYQAAERDHAERVNALNAAGAQVRLDMARKYDLDFPPLN